MKGMHGQSRRIVVALASVVGAYLLYAQFAIPWIEGPPKRLRDSALVTFDTPARTLDLSRWLPADAWELQPCKRLDTTLGHLLFQDYLPHDDGRVEVQPLTILFRPAGDPPDAPPIVLRSAQGAVLKFDGPLSLSGKTGQLEGGMFFGPVEIFRQATGPEQNDAWRVATSDVQLNNERIQTLQDVEFQFGPNQGRGRHLIVTLERDPLRAGQKTMSAVRGAARIELVQIRELLLEAPAHSLSEAPAVAPAAITAVAGSAPPTSALPTSTPADAQPIPWRVTCHGSLVVDIAAGQGHLSDQVELVSLRDPRDWLRADRLELSFAGPGHAAGSAASPAAATQAQPSQQWALHSIAAVGRPAQINFASRQIVVLGDRLSYDFARNAVRIVNSTPQALRQGNLELTARDLEYTRLADGTVGPTEIRGPGQLVQSSAEGQPPLVFSWQQGLSIENLASEKKLTVRGQVSGSLDPTTTLETDQVELWFRQAQAAAGSPATVEMLKLIATGNVHIAAERLDVRVQQLLAHWPPAAPTNPAAMRPAIARSQYVGSRSQEPGTQPAGSGRPAPAAAFPPAAASTQEALPLLVRGDVATIRFANRPQAPADAAPASPDFPPLEEITIDGKVLLQQKNPLSQEVELQIEGEQLNVIPQDATHRRAVVRGRVEHPVVITAAGFTVRGTKVTVDQRANRLWMDGAGQLAGQLAGELSSFQGGGPNLAPAANRSRPGPVEPLAVRTLQLGWQAGMVFDGQQIYFEGGVEAQIDEPHEAGLARTWVYCEAMNLSLEQRIDLSGEGGASTGPGAATEQAAIESITLARDVPSEQRVFPLDESNRPRPQSILERQVLDQQQAVLQLQRCDVPWLQLQVRDGKVTSNGPGTLTAWMPAASLPTRPSGLPGGASAAPSTPATGWGNTQIKFERGIEGDLQRSDLTFRENVRVIYGNVANTSEALDADSSQLTAGRYRLRSDELRVVQWQKTNAVEPHLEMIAQGQLELEGELFSALAQRLSFDQSREIIVLEGDTRNQARLEYQAAPGAPRNPLVAAKIKYRMRDQAAEAEGITHGVLSTGPLLERK